MWRQALGPKARETSGRILEISIGLQRILRFLGDIETALGVQVKPTVAMQLGSVQALASAIDSDEWPSPTPLVLMRDGNESEILYIVSAGSGVVLELCDLAQSIAFPGKIFGLQLPGLAGEAEPLTSIGAITEHYKTSILRYAPSSKTHVLGYSFGGLVALELGKRLRAEGHNVGLVGVLDSTCYEKYWPKIEWIKAAAKRVKRRLLEMKKGNSLSENLSFIKHCIVIAGLYLKRRFQPAAETTPEQSVYYIGGLDPHFQSVRNAAIIAFESYNPPSYEGKIVLFKSEFGDPNACDPLGIWKRKIADLELVHVSGTHATMIRKPFVKTLAEKVSLYLK
jgi:thioesterase domain-containing protein